MPTIPELLLKIGKILCPIGGNYYKVLAVRNNPVTDYQGTVYQDVRTNEIVVAHRGTASVTDDVIDLAMVINSVNYQAAESKKQCLYCQEQL